MAKKNTKSRYWVDGSSILPEIVVTPQGNYPILDEAGNPARTGTAYGASQQDSNVKAYGGLLEMANKYKMGGDESKGSQLDKGLLSIGDVFTDTDTGETRKVVNYTTGFYNGIPYNAPVADNGDAYMSNLYLPEINVLGNFRSSLDWSPESWFSLRTPKPDGTLYNEDEAERLRAHVPEYLNIEKQAKSNGTWLKMPDGSTWQGDPRSWVMMQSVDYRKNYLPQIWYTGQAEWPTIFDYGNGEVKTNKLTRAPYYDGQMWFSNDKSYGDAFAHFYDSNAFGNRRYKYWEKNIRGKNFLSAIPIDTYRELTAPKEGTSDSWTSMPYYMENNTILRLPDDSIKTRFDGSFGNVNSRKDERDINTDSVVNWSKDLKDKGIFMHRVEDGSGVIIPSMEDFINEGKYIRTDPVIEEFISQPGHTKKVKFIEGNTGDFDINNPYKYAFNWDDNDSKINFVANGGPLKSALWNDLSMREKADIIKVGVKHGLNRLNDIKSKYNEFAEGGNIYSGKEPHSQQMNQGYIYDILPQLYAMDGVNVRVSSGLRPNAVVYQNGVPTNRKSRHGMGQAVDIIPGEGATFNDIFRVLNNPNSNVSKWMRANGVGYIDETSATGTTKYWHDHKKDHSHVHHQIGGSPARQYATRFNVQQRPVNKAWERRAASYWPKAQAMYQELLSAGINPVAAAGILGNIAQESEFNPNAANSINGGHWGYLQNDKSITPWVRANYGGYDHRSQMNYLIAGLQGRLPKSNMGLDRRFNGFNARMQGVTDPEMAAYLWEREYEKSANEGVPQRKYFARYFYDRMMGNNGMVQQQYSQPVVMPQNPYPMPIPTVDYQKLAMQQMEMLQRDQEERARQAAYLAEKEQREAERNRRMGMLNLVMSMGAPEESNDNFFNSMLGLAMSNNAKKEETDYSSFNPFSLTV